MVKQVRTMAKPEPKEPPTEKADMKQLVDMVKRGIVDLTSLKFNTIVEVSMDDETHTHRVVCELVERAAIPDSMDLLGIYEIHADDSGFIQTFKRIGMRKRGDVTNSEDF
jgi:hypothetical protein